MPPENINALIMQNKTLFFSLFLFICPQLYGVAQIKGTAEDSLQISVSKKSNTFIGGYGDAAYQRDFNLKESVINLNRVVLFVGHRFNDKISFFSELELEDAKIEGGDAGGEFSVEQAYVKFNLNKSNYLTAGLFIPRIGMLNENHLPTDYNGVERPFVEKYIIPSTWREIGVGLYGRLNSFPISYSFAVCNGLNSATFEHGTAIRGGRFEGKNASANNLATTASLQYNSGSFRWQISGYAGGSVGLSPKMADSLKLKSGFFGTPAILGETNVQYEIKGLALKAIGTLLSIPDASDINRAYANNTPEMAYGFYGEIAYNVFESVTRLNNQKLWLFARYEKLDLNSKIPDNGIKDETLKQDHLIAGFSYQPILQVVIKADIRILKTGVENPSLVINPDPTAIPYERSNTFLNLAIGYSF